MGKITIEGYGKVLYEKEVPDKVAYAIAKEREKKDNEYRERMAEEKKGMNSQTTI